MRTLSELVFHNTYSELPKAFGCLVTPQPLDNPFLVSVNPHVCELLELDPRQANTPCFINVFTGNSAFSGFSPLAMKYTGHQFGQYNPDLGDGRGLLMGEVLTSTGKKWDIHLKGSGMTPYSRQGDGRAVLRSSIREYLACAAMQGLGIKTTHALAILGSTTPVYREKVERGATLIRVAESHLRFGHFEYLFYTGQHAELKLLADYLIKQHFDDLYVQQELLIHGKTDEHETEVAHKKIYAAMFQRIVDLTATMIANWQAAGFAHGVMNTDNMSVLGLTFDYGPYAFLDNYDPGFICNHSDYSGRYAFNQQPSIALWNLSALGYALSPLVEKDAIEQSLQGYQVQLQQQYSVTMRRKLGLIEKREEDTVLFSSLFDLLKSQAVDYTLFFRILSDIPLHELSTSTDRFGDLFDCPRSLNIWLTAYATRLGFEIKPFTTVQKQDDEQRLLRMKKHNPKFILRNYLAQQAIDKAQDGDFLMIEQLLQVLGTPFDEHPEFNEFAAKPPYWSKELAISCSS
ncbi:protein adenylyltransferase SelO [Photobacterium lipolyticum]|uniref:Protein nucleotidyltransferase YdiU n=1 Tax=Photobacterium lipolyticum TaxID=266810 RepID=A0A2T3N196_9GAMM|nr:YdiU family protein [Photobacterium lipolyticum]PSW06090.1 YdiU family protein [Photobacterium lipolyticum]